MPREKEKEKEKSEREREPRYRKLRREREKGTKEGRENPITERGRLRKEMVGGKGNQEGERVSPSSPLLFSFCWRFIDLYWSSLLWRECIWADRVGARA